MKAKAFVTAVSLILVIGYAYAGEAAEDLSDVKFKSIEAQLAQEKYNKAIEKAWKGYQEQVSSAEQMYVKELKLAMKNEIEKENLEEALKIQKEIRRHHADIQSGLILHYSFEKANITKMIMDKSGKGNHGKVHGAMWTLRGKIGGAYRFDINKKDNCIQVPDSNSLDVKKITMAVWIKTTCKDNNWNRIIDKDFRNGYTLTLGGNYGKVKRAGKVILELNKHFSKSDVVVADGKWHHIVGTYNGEIQKLYVDGQEQKEKIRWSGGISANDYDLAIGHSKIPYPPNYIYPFEGEMPKEYFAFDGTIDEVMIFNRALTSKEVKLLYESQKQP